MLRLLCWAIALVFISAASAVLAVDKPPHELFEKIHANPIVHQGKCNYHGYKGVDCLIYFEPTEEVIYLVLFNQKTEVTHVVEVKDKKEKILWQKANIGI